MAYQTDSAMRQIEMLTRYLARVVFKKDILSYKIVDLDNLSQTDLLYEKIMRLTNDNNICEAENVLYDMLDTDNQKHFEIAVDFYQTINKLSNNALEECNFSREEINEGLNKILKLYNIQNPFELM